MKNRKTADKRNLAPDEREERAKEVLRESGRQLSVLMGNLPGLVFRCQIAPEWTMEFISEGCLELTGYQPHELIGDRVVSFGSIIHPDDRSHVWDTIQAVANQASPYEVEYRIITKEMKEKWVWERGRCVCSQTVEPAILEGYICDITGRKRAENTLDFLARSSAGHASGDFFRDLARNISETLDMGFVCIDRLDGDNLTAHTVTVYSNGKFEDNVSYALKYTPCGEVVGKHVCCFPASIKTLFPNDAVLQQMEAESYIGVTLWSHDDRPIGLIAVIGARPISDREQAESLLKLVAERAAAELERTQAEEDLWETTMRLQESVRAANVGLWDWDLATNHVHYSTEWKGQIGYEDAEIGDEFEEWQSRLHPEDLAPTLKKIGDAIAGDGQHYQTEFRFRHKDGSYRWIVAQCSVSRDEKGRAVRVVGSHIDLTEQKQVTDALRRSEALLSASQSLARIGGWEWELSSRKMSWTDETYRIHELNPGDTPAGSDAHIARSLECYDESDRPAVLAAFRKCVEKGEPYDLEFPFTTFKGRRLWVRTSAQAVMKDGQVERVTGLITDITAHKKAEKEREESLLRAEAASHAKSEFLAVMSHELRSPLNGVLGFAGLLSDTPLKDEQKSFVQTISSSGEHLLSLVNDILDYASMEHGAMKILDAPLALAGLVDISRQTVTTIAAEKGIGLHTVIAPGVPEQILGDERRIRQILINLLNNAVKFTSEGSVVLRIAPAMDGMRRFLDFSVEDSGIGISPETLARLFQPFTQADSKLNRAYGGTGLGLSISKRLAEAMGGSISVTSTPAKGSKFTFRLPSKLSPGTPTPACPDQTSTGPLPGAPVLVVDDLEESRTLVGKVLQQLGYTAEFAKNGNEAVKAFTPGKYSAILMDLAMPGMDGPDATRRIREIETATGSHVPIIALTANVLAGACEQCLAAGMDDFLGKPFTKSGLAAKLQASW
jgi:PAS domain S-box-containing protein